MPALPRRTKRKRRILRPIIMVGLTLVAIFFYFFGPTHPQSDLRSQPDSNVLWVLSGAVTAESVSIKSKLAISAETVQLIISPNQNFEDGIIHAPVDFVPSENIYHFNPTNLRPNTAYAYALRVDGEMDQKTGHFTTFAEEAHSFSFAVGSCANSGSNGAVFDAIRATDPLFFLVTGDLHYENIEDPSSARYHDAYDLTFTQPAQAAVHRQMPLIYMWDDHDYGDNNSDGTNIGRTVVRQAYQAAIPHYPLAAGDGDKPIYQSFSIGRTRFILTDLRSERDPADAPDNANKTMLGATQKAWFKQELLQARDQQQLIFWVSTVPWNGGPSEGADNWRGYTTERTEIANFIAENQIENLVILSGDAHMLAFDDGTNSNFATTPGYSSAEKQGMPIFHAAALDRRGSTKGGEFSHGTFPAGGQFGRIDVNEIGDNQLEVTFTGYNHKMEEILTQSVVFDLENQ